MIETALPSTEKERIVVDERLRLLAIAAYIRGGITAAFSCFFLVYVLMFAVIAAIPDRAWTDSNTNRRTSSTNAGNQTASPSPTAPNANQGPPRLVFGIMAAIFGGVALLGASFGGLTAYAGRCIQRRQRRLLILVVAGLNCIFLPYGTLFSVAAIVILSSPVAKAEFEGGQS